ncbi:MAG: nucleotidyltransferase family protein [Candidatus Latescibacteria bacterium]|nr:nucleotidyltransferase family protein [Candidatus Latescibacterota bacterium]
MRQPPPLLLATLGEGKALAQLGADQWEGLVSPAAEEGLEGLFYQRCTAESVALPHALGDNWRSSYRQTAEVNFAALQRLGGLLAAMGAEQVLLLPGAALLPFYPDPGCRPMDDLDLLVRPEVAGRFRDLLQGRGFAAVPRHPGLWVSGDLALDLHEDLLNTARIRTRRYAGWMDLAEVWRDSRSTRVEGVEVGTMGLEDMVLYTAVHALRHSFRRLTWFLDLHLLLQAGIDWERLEDKAGRYNLVRPLVYGLGFLQEQAACPLPEPAAALLARIPLRTGEAYLLRQSFQDRRRAEWGDVLWAFSIPQLGRRCRFLAETCFPQPQVLLQVFPYLPAPLFPLAYGLRLLQLLLLSSRQLRWLLARSQAQADRVAL